MPTKKDISHLSPEEQSKIEARRLRQKLYGEQKRRAAGKPTRKAKRDLSGLSAEEKKAYFAEYEKIQRAANAEHIRERKKITWSIYYQANKEHLNARTAVYNRERQKVDLQFKLAGRLRTRLWFALSGVRKVGSFVRDIGCSIPELVSHLESQFTEGMSWDNYGLYGWHMDHIIPLSSFDLTDREQFLQACHYTNLQPLWAKDNLSKGSKLSGVPSGSAVNDDEDELAA